MPTTTAMTNDCESLVLNSVLNGVPIAGTDRVTYIGVLSAAGSDSSQTQMSGSSRVAIAFTSSSGGSAVTNTGVISFTNSGWASTSVYGVGFYNQASAGAGDKCLLYGNFDSVVTVGAGQSLQFNISGITISMD
jgi:hypothetical protein